MMLNIISFLSGIKKRAKINFSKEKKLMDLENGFVVARGGGGGVGWLGSLGLINMNYYLWNGLAM